MNTLSAPRPDRRRAARWLLGGLGLPALAVGYGAGTAWRLEHSGEPAVPEDICRVAPLQAWTPALGRGRLAARMPPPEARCPVCGMFPARQPRWACQLIYRDGAAHFFDAALDLLLYLQDPGRHAPGYGRRDIARLYLPEAGADDHRWIAAEDATLLLDSTWSGSVGSPMRRGALPAFADAAQARALQTAHGGELWSWQRLQALPAVQWPPSLRGLGPRHAHGAR
ncbi:nitrous oxide reductase accessory protein NosL [Mitsuaria sp. WAJ17]|uniref:nitrous oxide reductase accessory protein NosL n=1 Tax=Mitsuaria sp. WAJ17 TaxID=2761452 RepID=UPI0015FFC594|nr:nitrous oxide reductase accessory protein NosL [Mitsuaria sp. WAJ17]MBB2485922.1 nitrous oxide reductase accessory protein NosL [Mitsuaria sp. WAJ17]